MKNITRLTDLEIKIMGVLWEHDQCLTSQEIADYMKKDKISAASVMQAMKRLVEKKAVTVSDLVPVSRVYARAFSPSYSKEEFLAREFGRLQKFVSNSNRIDITEITASLLNDDENQDIKLEDVEELQKLIEHKKKQLLDGE